MMVGNIFAVSLYMSAVILLFLLLSPAVTRRYAAKWSVLVWMLIALRLAVPVHVSLPEAPIRIPEVKVSRTAAVQPVTNFEVAETENPEQPAPAPTVTAPADSEPQRSISGELLAFFVWLSGAVLFLVYHVLGYALFRYRIKSWCRPFMAGTPKVVICKKVTSPMLVGFFKPTILLPQVSYSDADLETILTHEQTHYKNKDLWRKLLLLLANAVHWFNPLVYVMVHAANCSIEYACDETVTKNKDLEFRKSYSRAILSAMRDGQNIALSTCFNGGKRDMKKRFFNILSTAKKRKGILLVLLCVLIIVSLGLSVAFGSNTTYTNKALGISFKLPSDWQEKYLVQEEGEMITVYHAPIHAAYNGMGYLFYIQRLDGDFTEAAPEVIEPGNRKICGKGNGYTYVLGRPTDVQVPLDNAELQAEYYKMAEEIDTVLNAVKITKPSGAPLPGTVTSLYGYKNTYVGDAARVRNMLELTKNFVSVPVHSITLKTNAEPYRLTVNYKVESRSDYRFFLNANETEKMAAVLFALIPNADEILVQVYDRYADMNKPDEAFCSRYIARNQLQETNGLEAFTPEYIAKACDSLESFESYYDAVSAAVISRGSNASLTELYHLIGNDCEIVVNATVRETFVAGENSEFEQKLQKILGNAAVDASYNGKELDVVMRVVRNFKKDLSWPWLFVYDQSEGKNKLVTHKNLMEEMTENAVVDTLFRR